MAEALTGLILAGGAGRRMGGADKGLVDYRGRPLVAHAAERLLPQVDYLLISANRNHATYATFGHPVLADTPAATAEAFPGPLAGLAAGLTACGTPWLLCVPCDCPALPLDLASRLRQAAEQAHVPIAIARTDDGLQPTFQLCRRDLLTALKAYLSTGRRKVSDWCREQNAVEVIFADAGAFANLNHLQELKNAIY